MRIISKTITLLSLILFFIVTGLGLAQEPVVPTGAAGAPVSTGFTYQGQLTKEGKPVNATCSMTFRLFDEAGVGSQVGPEVNHDISAANGLFTVSLDFGSGVFEGSQRWLDTAVQCPGDSAPTSLGRQALSAAPYALHALDAAQLGGLPASAFFKSGGNATAADAVLGTTSNHGLEIRVNNQRALLLLPANTPNLIGGHHANRVDAGVRGATIGGGGSGDLTFYNHVTNHYGTVSGGRANTAGEDSAVGGGFGNKATGFRSTIGGGEGNLASGDWSTVVGGFNNQATGKTATVVGGSSNIAQGLDSFAAGRRAEALANGCFVWADSSASTSTKCTSANRTIFQSSGGYVIYTNPSNTNGTYLLSGGSSWNSFSAREHKENFSRVDARRLLERLAAIEITTWNYTSQSPDVLHIGPMADDFNALVDGLGGEGQDYINTLDAQGVALAGVQGLYEITLAQEAEIAALKIEIERLDARLSSLEAAQSGTSQKLSAWESLLLPGAALSGAFVLFRRQRGQP